MLIGRKSEFVELTGALDRAAAADAGVVLVSGDAGVGKTRLVGELSALARERGYTVLVGQCAELGESIPYLPLADALWTATRDSRLPEDRLTELRKALAARPVLARLLPDGPGGAEPLQQQQLYGAALGLLGELADTAPVLLVLEDLHWADRSTRDLLTFLSRVLERERICLIGTYRSDDLHRRHPLRPVVAELGRLPNVSAVELRPFGPAETATYLAALDDTDGLPAEVVEQVYARSEGNAFYAAELLAAARAEGDLAGQDLPTGLADLLLARVERLTDAAQQVVRVAAVAGRRVDDRLVRQVSGLDESACEQALREIVSHQLLVPDGPAGYAFRHALLREAVYGDLLPGEKTRLHAAFAELLAHDGGQPAELAYHSLAAHDLPTAFAASLAAAHQAERVGAPSEAHEHYDRALSLWEAVPDPEGVAGTDRARLSLRAAAASHFAGEVRRAMTRVRRLLELVDPADVLLVGEIRERLAYYLGDLEQEEESLRVAREAIDGLPEDPPTPQRARALATYLRSAQWWSQRYAEVPELIEETITVARAAGAADAEANALIALALLKEPQQADSGAQEIFEKVWELARDSEDLQVALRAGFHRARAAFDRGELARAAAAIEDGIGFTDAAGAGWSGYGINMRYMQFQIAFATGDWPRAERLADTFRVRVTLPTEAELSSHALFLDVARGSARVAERERWLAPLLTDNTYVTYLARGILAEHRLWDGDVESGLADAHRALEYLDDYNAGAIRVAATALWGLGDQAVRARSAGSADRSALATADRMLARARAAATHVTAGQPRVWLGLEGHAWLTRAEAEWHRAHGDDEPAHWRASVEAFDYGFVYEVARSRWRLAECLAEHGDREAAHAEWRQAVETAERLGAAPLRRALAELGRRARFTEAAGTQGPLATLTGREREVLRLVAEGLANREIAAALFISPKTASVHVSNIMAKLGVTSRTQAAAVAHRAGLPARPAQE